MTSAFFLVPLILYRNRNRLMTKFCLRMTALVAARKLYRQVLLILLYVFHFLYLCVHQNDVGIIGSTMAFVTFYIFMDVDKWLHRLHEGCRFFCIIALIAVVLAFIPHLFTMSATVSFILLAALFYPSRAILSLWESEDGRTALVNDKNMLVECYY